MYRRSLLRMGSTIAPKKRLGATLGATLKVAKIEALRGIVAP